MKIVVAGASGFLGSWTAINLARSHEVVALGRESTDFWRINNQNNVRKVRIPFNLWPEFLNDQDPDVLVLADWSGVANLHRNEMSQIENVDRWVNLLSAYKGKRLRSVVGFGSQAELGPNSGLIYENTSDNPTTIYGQAKIQARTRLNSICEQFGLRFVWMRIFSTYGPLDVGNWLIPSLVDSLSKGLFMRLTAGEQEWSFLHAHDFAQAITLVIESSSIHGVINTGNSKTLLIKNVAEKIANYFDRADLLGLGEVPYRHDQVMELKPVCETLSSLGWSPKVSFDAGLIQTIEWLEGKKVGPLIDSDGQILDITLSSRP